MLWFSREQENDQLSGREIYLLRSFVAKELFRLKNLEIYELTAGELKVLMLEIKELENLWDKL